LVHEHEKEKLTERILGNDIIFLPKIIFLRFLASLAEENGH